MSRTETINKLREFLNGQFSPEELDRRLQDRSDRNMPDITGAELQGVDLPGADFRGMTLTQVDFSGAELCRADFSGSLLYGADFGGANIEDATFEGARGLRPVQLAEIGSGLESAYGLPPGTFADAVAAGYTSRLKKP